MSSDAGPDGGRSLRVEPAHSWARAESSGIGADCRCSRHSEAASVASKWSLTKDGVPPEEELEDVLDAVMRQRVTLALGLRMCFPFSRSFSNRAAVTLPCAQPHTVAVSTAGNG